MRPARRSRTTARPAAGTATTSTSFPGGCRFAADQLPARRPSPREQGFRRGGRSSTSAPPTTTRRTPSRRPPAMPRSSPTASSPKGAPTEQDAVKRDAVASSIKFADAFPDHEHAAAILGAAADDLYEMKDYRPAVASARRVLDTYPARGCGHPALGVGRRGARLVRARRVPAGRAGVHARCWRSRRRVTRRAPARRQPRRLDLQAG